MFKRRYIVLLNDNHLDKYFDITSIDPYESPSIRSWDQKLHQALCKIFREHRRAGGQVEQLLRDPVERTNKNSIYEQILREEPTFGKLFRMRSKLSLLWIAVLSCYQASAELLVRCGANVNEPYGLNSRSANLCKKTTVLHALLRMYPSSWNEQFTRLVIDTGADLKAQDFLRNTVLHLATAYGRVELTEVLLEKGADINAVQRFGMTPLLEAAINSQVEDQLVPMLIKHGADITARDNEGSNVLLFLTASYHRENLDLIKILIEKGLSPRETSDSIQPQPIHKAVWRGKNDLVNLFLDHGANVNALTRGQYIEFPLYIAAQDCEKPEVLLTLLKRGANIDLKNYRGETALHALTFSDENTVEKMKLLLSVGADMFAEDYDGWTPFELIPLENEEGETLRQTMLKTLALRKACLQPSVEFKDELIIKEQYPELWNRYQDCVDEIARIKSTKFIKTGDFYELLTKCQCRIVPLMRNLEFRSKFRLYDFSDFPMYAEDLREAFERAEPYYQLVLEQEALIDDAVYNTWPYLITRKMASFALRCEICKLKKTVRASRTSK